MVDLREVHILPTGHLDNILSHETRPKGAKGESWRRERDLNSRGTGPRDFQSRALPGYAISALVPPSPLLRLTVTHEVDSFQGPQAEGLKGTTPSESHGRGSG